MHTVAAERLRDPVAVVGPDQQEVGIRELLQRGHEVLDALPGGDPPDVEEHGRALRDAERGPVGRLDLVRRRETVPAHVDPLARHHARRGHVLALEARGDDDGRRSGGHAAIERRVERLLQRHLPQPRAEHAQRLEHIGGPGEARPRGDGGRHRVAEAEHVHDVGPSAPG